MVDPVTDGEPAQEEKEAPHAEESMAGDDDSTTSIFDDLKGRLDRLKVDSIN